MKAIRIFLLILIIIGVGLLFTQSLWVPKLVDKILQQEGPRGTIHSTQKLEYKTYHSQKFNVTVRIPKDWKIDPNADFGTGILNIFSSPDLKEEQPAGEGDPIIRNGGELSLGEDARYTASEYAAYEQTYRNGCNKREFCISSQKINLDGQNITMYTYKGYAGDFWSSADFTYQDKIRSFIFRYSSDLANHQEILGQFIEGFKFDN